MNALSQPIGANGLYLDPNYWFEGDNPSASCTVDAWKEGFGINLHKVLSYLDSYRVTLANTQERTAYYIGVGVREPGYVWLLDSTDRVFEQVSLNDPSQNKIFDYSYVPVSLRSMDNFMAFIRYYTSDPSFVADGEFGSSGVIPLSLDLSDPNALRNFIFSAIRFLANCEGRDPQQNNFLDARLEMYGALYWFIGVLGLGPCFAAVDMLDLYDLLFKPADEDDGDVKDIFASICMLPHLQNGGYFLSTYEMDLNRAMLDTSVGLTKSTVDASAGSFTIDAFRFNNSVQKVIDLFDISGGRLSSWLRKFWHSKPDKSLDCAELLHVTSSYIGNTDIISTADTMQGDQGTALAQQAGYTIGKFGGQHDRFTADSYGVFMQIMTLIPLVSYSQGISASDRRKSLHDCFLPQYANIGFQDVPVVELCAHAAMLPRTDGAVTASSGGNNPVGVVGRRPAWQDYRTRPSRSFGNFGIGAPLSYWTLGRYYQDVFVSSSAQDGTASADVDDGRFGIRLAQSPEPLNTTSYIWPRWYNYLFAQADDSAQNFRVKGTVTYKGTRNVPAPKMPSL